MKRLMVVGACYIDTILSVSHYPREDEKLRATETIRRRGGNGELIASVRVPYPCFKIGSSRTLRNAKLNFFEGPNSLEVLLQLVEQEPDNTRLKLLLCSILPGKESTATSFIESSFNNRLSLAQCIYRENESEAASSYIIKSSETGSRTIVNYNALEEMTSDEFARITSSLDSPADWFHFEGRIPDVTLACIQHIRQTYPSAKVSVEVEKSGRDGLRELSAEADVVFYSRSWAQGEGYAGSRECLKAEMGHARRAHLICCTWGEEGATLMQLSDMQTFSCPAYQAPGFELKDSTGAGDTFVAGMLFGLLSRPSWSHGQRLDFAVMISGRKVSQEGFAGLGAVLRDYESRIIGHQSD